MTKQRKHLYEFDGFRVNVGERLLQRQGQDVPLPPKVFDLLLALVARHGEVVTKDQLMSKVWPDTFVEEANLKVYVSTLRKALGEGGEGAKFIETLPRRGYRFVGSVSEILPEPPAPLPELVIERQTVSRIVIEEQEISPPPVHPVTALLPGAPAALRHPWVFGVAALLLVLAGWFAGQRWRTGGEKIESLAVLPFTALTAEAQPQEAEHLGIGLTDALITRLSNVGGFAIRPTSAVLKFTASDRDALTLARKLGVDAILDGHLQRSGEQIRLTVQLLRTADGQPLWAGSFEEPQGNLFALQRAISEKLAHALTLKLTTDQQHKLKKDYTANAAAFEAYTRGRYFYGKQNQEAFEKALAYFRQAIELDPNYALAWAGIADCYNSQSTTISSLGATPHHALFTEARAAAERALSLDDSLAEAHVSLGVSLTESPDSTATHRELQRAITLNPNLPSAHSSYAMVLMGEAHFAEALAEIDRAHQLDPLSSAINTNRGLILFRARRRDEAVAQFRKVLELDANFVRAYYGLGMVLGTLRHDDEAIATLKKAVELSKGASVPLSALGYTFAITGRRAEAQEILTRLLELHEQKMVAPLYVGLVYAGLGDKEQAFVWLEKIKGGSILRIAAVDERFDLLRGDERFAALLPH